MGGGVAAGKLTKSIADEMVEDDAEALTRVLEKELRRLSLEYMLSEWEVEQIIVVVRNTADAEWLRSMYKETSGRNEPGRRFVRRKFNQEFKKIAKRRQKVTPPSAMLFRRQVESLAKTAE